jgi:hypothetical protein
LKGKLRLVPQEDKNNVEITITKITTNKNVKITITKITKNNVKITITKITTK